MVDERDERDIDTGEFEVEELGYSHHELPGKVISEGSPDAPLHTEVPEEPGKEEEKVEEAAIKEKPSRKLNKGLMVRIGIVVLIAVFAVPIFRVARNTIKFIQKQQQEKKAAQGKQKEAKVDVQPTGSNIILSSTLPEGKLVTVDGIKYVGTQKPEPTNYIWDVAGLKVKIKNIAIDENENVVISYEVENRSTSDFDLGILWLASKLGYGQGDILSYGFPPLRSSSGYLKPGKAKKFNLKYQVELTEEKRYPDYYYLFVNQGANPYMDLRQFWKGPFREE